MDIRRVKAKGKTKKGIAGLTVRPFRSLLWRLSKPWFQGVLEEVEEVEARIASLLTSRLGELSKDSEAQIASLLTSRLGGLSKDLAAIAHRLASLEEGSAAISAGYRIGLGEGNLALVRTTLGTKSLVIENDLIGRTIANGAEWEPHVRRAIEQAARRDGVAVDVGAYIGLHTVTMSRAFGTVHAFEPQRSIYQLLCGNLALNCCTNVISYNLALFDCECSMRLAPAHRQEIPVPMVNGQPDYARITNAAALTFDPLDEPNEPGEVRGVTLDSLALEDVTLVKIDAQGADLRVLRGAEATLRRYRPVVLFEWEKDLGAQHGASLDGFHDFFAKLDYEITVLHETSPGRQADYMATPR